MRAGAEIVGKELHPRLLVGGLICLFGEALIQTYSGLCGLSREDAGTLSAVT